MYMTTSKYIIITMDYWLLDKNTQQNEAKRCLLVKKYPKFGRNE